MHSTHWRHLKHHEHALQDAATTVAVFFDIMSNKKDQANMSQQPAFFLQFSTKYLSGEDGSLRQRVTTVSRK